MTETKTTQINSKALEIQQTFVASNRDLVKVVIPLSAHIKSQIRQKKLIFHRIK
jgi:hypothetical protein